ncbi:putative transposase [Pseudoduganella lurida]|uniref:Putative transposase n=1 Tax=Pseudoduganella lurida TaxID=1036180 RepID=A0A562QZ27_9BURK|nr:transposase [Pseudoduganella lurida]TWI62079.1 putative transposase [Pseudoduganella lurida]
MPRRARLVSEQVPLHIIQRGNNRQVCFLRNEDYVAYLGWLNEYARSNGATIHAYVLMSNHVHLLASFSDLGGPASLMKGVSQQYSQYFNWWYERSGTVWEGRYRSSLVAEDTYFLICQRYIELNPVRAGMVSSPHEYRWSSHRGNAGYGVDSLLTPHPLYCNLGHPDCERQLRYRELFSEELSPASFEMIREAIRSNRPIGSLSGRRGRPRKRTGTE